MIASLARTCWNTGGRRRTWHSEQRPSRVAHDIATPLRTRATCSKSAISRGSRSLTSDARASVACVNDALNRRELLRELLLLGVDLLLPRRQRRLGALGVGGDRVGLEHALEHLLFDSAEIGLRGGDLVLHRLVFAVGLDGGELIFELGETALIDGDVFLERAPGFLFSFSLAFAPRRRSCFR